MPKKYDKEAKPAYYSGKRIKRGLYRSKDGTLINADVNGAFEVQVFFKKLEPRKHFEKR